MTSKTPSGVPGDRNKNTYMGKRMYRTMENDHTFVNRRGAAFIYVAQFAWLICDRPDVSWERWLHE